MNEDLESDVPCASIAVDSVIRVATAGAIWGFCSGPHDATKQGLTGRHHASFVVYLGVFSLLLAVAFKGSEGKVNGCIAGAIAGAAVAVRTRSWKEVISVAALLSTVIA
ncbi:Outer envelope pore protein 16-4, chloroplastic-like protein [Drosera capensis]